jgi:predicted nucleic acid-binding Zn finger protein
LLFFLDRKGSEITECVVTSLVFFFAGLSRTAIHDQVTACSFISCASSLWCTVSAFSSVVIVGWTWCNHVMGAFLERSLKVFRWESFCF